MKTTQISVTLGRKFNLGDYCSAHFEITLWAELEEGDDPEQARNQLWAEAKASVKEQALPVVRPKRAQAEEVFAGLPVDVQEHINGH